MCSKLLEAKEIIEKLLEVLHAYGNCENCRKAGDDKENCTPEKCGVKRAEKFVNEVKQ